MQKRGIEEFEKVQIDPWPAGSFGLPVESGRRICRCLSYMRDHPEDNGYARPVEGVIAFVDMARGKVLEVIDHGVIPLPPEKGSYLPEDNGPLRQDLRPLTVVQPEGPSFTVEGNQICWQKWSLRASLDPTEGLVLHSVALEDHGKRRSVLHRASVTEMVVPYGEPGPMHGWKNAFDAGEWGLGRMANSLVLGCDCLGEVTYLDAVGCTEKGKPFEVRNAICIHEEDYGILWKHVDMFSGRTEVRRSRRLVVSSISTVGNYEYGFYWYFYLDGTMQLEVKLTGILSTMAVDPDARRPEIRIDGGSTTRSAVPPASVQRPYGHGGRRTCELRLGGGRRRQPSGAGESDGQFVRDCHDRSRIGALRLPAYRPVAEPDLEDRQPQGNEQTRIPVAFKLFPGPTPTLLAGAESSVARRAASRTTTCGSPVSTRRKEERPAITPISTPAVTAFPGS